MQQEVFAAQEIEVRCGDSKVPSKLYQAAAKPYGLGSSDNCVDALIRMETATRWAKFKLDMHRQAIATKVFASQRDDREHRTEKLLLQVTCYGSGRTTKNTNRRLRVIGASTLRSFLRDTMVSELAMQETMYDELSYRAKQKPRVFRALARKTWAIEHRLQKICIRRLPGSDQVRTQQRWRPEHSPQAHPSGGALQYSCLAIMVPRLANLVPS